MGPPHTGGRCIQGALTDKGPLQTETSTLYTYKMPIQARCPYRQDAHTGKRLHTDKMLHTGKRLHTDKRLHIAKGDNISITAPPRFHENKIFF